MDTRNQPAESLGCYPSEYITGRESNIPRSTAEFCLKESTIAEFWRESVKAIRRQSDCDVDGVVYIGAHDYDNDVELHGVVRLLNQYYKDHEIEILKNI